MTVEITPSGSAALIAQQLLAVAEADERFRVDDVKTTTYGPMGLAFLVPDELHEAWAKTYLAADDEPADEVEDSTEADAAPRRRGRPRTTGSAKE